MFLLSKILVNPYRLFLKNEHYYLVSNYDKYENILYLRIEELRFGFDRAFRKTDKGNSRITKTV